MRVNSRNHSVHRRNLPARTSFMHRLSRAAIRESASTTPMIRDEKHDEIAQVEKLRIARARPVIFEAVVDRMPPVQLVLDLVMPRLQMADESRVENPVLSLAERRITADDIGENVAIHLDRIQRVGD